MRKLGKVVIVLGAIAIVFSSQPVLYAQNISVDNLEIKLEGYVPPKALTDALTQASNIGDNTLLQAAMIEALSQDSANAKSMLKLVMLTNLDAGLDVFQNVFQEFVGSQDQINATVLADVISGAVESGMSAAVGDSDKVLEVIQTIVTTASESLAGSENADDSSLSILTGSVVEAIIASNTDPNSDDSFKMVEMVADSAASGAVAAGGSPAELTSKIQSSMAGIVDMIMDSGATSDINVEEMVDSVTEGAEAGIVAALGQNNTLAQILTVNTTSGIEESVTANEFETASDDGPLAEVDGTQSVSPN